MSAHRVVGSSAVKGRDPVIDLAADQPLSGEEATILAILAKAQWLPPEEQEKLTAKLNGVAADIGKSIIEWILDSKSGAVRPNSVWNNTPLDGSKLVAKYFIDWAANSK